MDQVFARSTRLQKRLEDEKTPLAEAGAYLLDSVHTNFEAQGRPRAWRPLAESTLAGRRRRGTGERILHETGALEASIHEVFSGSGVAVGTDEVQANRLNWGYPGGSGRGHAKTPARPFVMIQSWDIDPIDAIFTDHYMS